MSIRSVRASRSHIKSPEQLALLEDLLTVFDKHAPYRTLDAIEVLAVMMTTLITTHCSAREHAEIVMSRVVSRMDDVLNREAWAEEHPELRRH